MIRDADEAGWFTASRNTAERVHGIADTALKMVTGGVME
jgi:hypothetical protein